MKKINRQQITSAFPQYTTATLQNSWVAYGDGYAPARYYKDSMGVVHLSGLIKNGTLGTPAFILPAGYRPTFRLIFTAPSTSNNAICRVDIAQNGEVRPETGGSGGNGWVSLEGVHFAAEQ